jgi:hypothetical protein
LTNPLSSQHWTWQKIFVKVYSAREPTFRDISTVDRGKCLLVNFGPRYPAWSQQETFKSSLAFGHQESNPEPSLTPVLGRAKRREGGLYTTSEFKGPTYRGNLRTDQQKSSERKVNQLSCEFRHQLAPHLFFSRTSFGNIQKEGMCSPNPPYPYFWAKISSWRSKKSSRFSIRTPRIEPVLSLSLPSTTSRWRSVFRTPHPRWATGCEAGYPLTSQHWTWQENFVKVYIAQDQPILFSSMCRFN